MARYTRTGGVNTVPAINAELEKIENAFKDMVSRKGDVPNTVEANLDMDGNAILNVSTDPSNPNSLVSRADTYIRSEIDNKDSNVLDQAQQYADLVASGQGISVIKYIQEELPTGPNILSGTRWYKPSEATTYIYYMDEDGAQWVEEPVARPEIKEDKITTLDLINSSFDEEVITVEGYASVGDGGKAQWLKTGDTSTPSQSPAQRGDGTLTDATGAVWRLVSNKVNAKAFGLSGSGDDTSVLQAIANWLNPDREVEFTDNFAITSTVTFSNGGKLTLNDTVIDGTGLPNSTTDRTLNQAIIFTGSLESAVSISADIAAGDETFAAVGAGLSVGDTVIVRSDQPFVDGWEGSVNNRRGEILTISGVSGDTYSVSERFKFSYSSASNLRVEKMNPTSPKIKGGLLQMGGVGSEHRGVQVIYARNAEIDGLIVKGAEDTSVSIEYSHTVSYRGECWDATTPTTGFNTGYGVASINGSRNIDIDVVGYNCKHVVTAGGFLPSLETKIKGVAYNSGRTATAFDCHEPCFGWDWNVECYGGNAGIGIRGSEQKVRIKAENLDSNAVRVKAEDNPSIQYGIDIEAETLNTGSTAILIDTSSCPIDDVKIKARVRETQVNGFASIGDAVNGVSNLVIDIDCDTSASRAFDIRFTEGVKGSVKCRNAGERGLQIFDSSDIDLNVDVESSTSNAVYLLRVNGANLKGLKAKSATTAAIFTDDCSDINVSINNVEAIGVASDCWRAVDTVGGKLIGSTLNAGRQGVVSSGTSDAFIVTNNDGRAITNADKYILSGVNNVESNNIA